MDTIFSDFNPHVRKFKICELTQEDELKYFIGAAPDRDSSNIIVTYTYNVIKYKISDKEPYNIVKECEWKTKCRLTSSVVYDAHSQCYVGVFNDDIIRTWACDTDSVDEALRYKFRHPILKVLVREEKPALIIFANGDCVSLAHGLEHCKTHKSRALIKESSCIVDCVCHTRNQTEHVCYVVRNADSTHHVVTCPLTDDTAQCELDNMRTIKVTRKDNLDAFVVGNIIAGTENPVVHFMWCDKVVSKYYVNKDCWRSLKRRDHFFSYIDEIVMADLGKDIFLMYAKSSYNQPDDSRAVVMISRTDLNYACHNYHTLKPHVRKAKFFNCKSVVILCDYKRLVVFKDITKNNDSYP